MKSYTDLEQSKKLAEILPIESADACWTNHLFNAFLSSWRIESTTPQEYKNLLDGFVVRGYLIEPAWSLSALFEVIPKHIEDYAVFRMDMGEKDFSIWYDDLDSGTVDENLPDITKDNPIDACYEMIVKLKETNLL